MALTRIGGANAITGTIPQGNIANASLGAVTALPAGVGGKIVQMVSATTSSSTTVSSGSFTSTSLTANITPSSASNKIIIWSLGGEADTGSANYSMQPSIFRDSTNIGNGTAGMNTVYATGTRMQGNPTVGVVDSPSSTSQITYTLKIKGAGGSTTFNANTCQATIILMEITP